MNRGDSVLTTREIALQVKGLVPPSTAILQIHIEEHVGGSRYNQVYRVRPVNNDAASVGLIPTATYCLKVYHVPFCWFCPCDTFMSMIAPRRKLLDHMDRVGRIGALWHLLVRRAATITLGDPDCVPKIYATFYDQNLRAFGTIEEWAPGRSWRLEMDDAVFDRTHPPPDPDYHHPSDFPNEYTAKRFFMARFARLLREMGATGLAERYDWRNWRSIRRVVLRAGFPGPYHGLAATDFEPAKSDANTLRSFLEKHAGNFDDVRMAAEELLALLDAPPREPGDFTPVMPKANPAIAHLLWLWSQKEPRPLFRKRLLAAVRNSIKRMKEALRLARDPVARSVWLVEQVDTGLEESRISEEEAMRIRSQVNDPDVQLYLQCFFVHICTLPITTITVICFSVIYSLVHGLDMMDTLRLIIAWSALFAVLPISPGSISRGLYVVWVAWRRKLAARLRIALALSFWRYVGFFSFPLQMVQAFPALSRFAASLWVARLIRLIPHYGKTGGLLEHRIFDLLFNLPLTIGRLRRERTA